jgi:diguanylate cyclase (GGDEF)-like protein
MDVDNFKHIALTYGHDASKQLLKEFASIVKSHLRVMDAAGRYGFDEIAILREKTSKNDALEFAEKMRKAIEAAVLTGNKIQTSVSIGLALFPEHARTEKELLLNAKEALYEAQRSGRNRVVTAF